MLNNVTLVGRLTKSPEIKYTSTGKAVCSFTLAVNRQFKKDNQPDADFVQIVCWNRTAENAGNFLDKGSLAGIIGRINTRNYDGQDGKKVYVTEVVAESVQFLEPKGSQGNQQSQQQNSKPSYTKNDDDPFVGNKPYAALDSELPF